MAARAEWPPFDSSRWVRRRYTALYRIHPYFLRRLQCFFAGPGSRLERWVFCAVVSYGYLRAEISQICESLLDAEPGARFRGPENDYLYIHCGAPKGVGWLAH